MLALGHSGRPRMNSALRPVWSIIENINSRIFSKKVTTLSGMASLSDIMKDTHTSKMSQTEQERLSKISSRVG